MRTIAYKEGGSLIWAIFVRMYYVDDFIIKLCKFQILQETNFLTEILRMRHLLLREKKTETTLFLILR